MPFQRIISALLGSASSDAQRAPVVQRRGILGAGLAAWALSGMLSLAAWGQNAPQRDVTFMSTSDCHYAAFVNEDRNDRDRDTIKAMNQVTALEWPASLGGGKIAKPRGVTVLGDCIDDGDRQFKTKDGKMENQSAKQYEYFSKDFGLDGTDGLLKFPVFEGWGNHDGPPIGKEKFFSSQSNIKKRNVIRLEKKLISNVSENGLHYSWDWDDVHFVQLNIYPADQQRAGIHYSPVWHDPQKSLSFLKDDLAQKVGKSGRPIVLVAHCGFDTNWWVKEDWKEFYNAVKEYNVILYIFGHTGTGVGAYAPEGESKKITWINDGQTENGFFVINIKGDQLKFAYRAKNWQPATGADGKPSKKWNGDWKWLWDRSMKIAGPVAAPSEK